MTTGEFVGADCCCGSGMDAFTGRLTQKIGCRKDYDEMVDEYESLLKRIAAYMTVDEFQYKRVM